LDGLADNLHSFLTQDLQSVLATSVANKASPIQQNNQTTNPSMLAQQTIINATAVANRIAQNNSTQNLNILTVGNPNLRNGNITNGLPINNNNNNNNNNNSIDNNTQDSTPTNNNFSAINTINNTNHRLHQILSDSNDQHSTMLTTAATIPNLQSTALYNHSFQESMNLGNPHQNNNNNNNNVLMNSTNFNHLNQSFQPLQNSRRSLPQTNDISDDIDERGNKRANNFQFFSSMRDVNKIVQLNPGVNNNNNTIVSPHNISPANNIGNVNE
jgi:hypothetical protein